MHKLLSIITMSVLGLAVTGNVFAADSLSVRMEQPKSPSNMNTLKITVVALDRQNRPVTVQCMKKAQSEAVFTQFGSDIVVAAGGNSVNCETSTSVMPNDATYYFKARALAGSDSIDSSEIEVVYNTSGPGTPTNYSKENVNACDYKIKFRTADDSGKTVKVEVYRSENTTFDLNNGSKVDTISIGSSTDGSSTTTRPVCDKTYYFALRAFDTAGNGSGVIGDEEVHFTTSTTTTTTLGGTSEAASGALAAGTGGNILGASSGPTGFAEPENGGILGEASSEAKTETYKETGTKKFPTIPVLVGIAILGLIVFALRKKE